MKEKENNPLIHIAKSGILHKMVVLFPLFTRYTTTIHDVNRIFLSYLILLQFPWNRAPEFEKTTRTTMCVFMQYYILRIYIYIYIYIYNTGTR